MKRIIHLKTKRVYSYKSNGLPNIEESVIKLTPDSNFEKFVKHIHLKGYSEAPQVVRVIEDGEDVDVSKYQQIVNDAIAEKQPQKQIDYKALAEKQANELIKQKGLIDSFEERLNKLENIKPIKATLKVTKEARSILETKANELEIAFRPNIGDAKLLAKIQEIDPEFKIEL